VLSYGPYIPDEYRREASYVDRILKSAKPSELPVLAPSKLELVINLKTAKALGLEVAGQLQQLADELIEQVHVCYRHKADMVIALSNVSG
jgi:putative tryptophan/tyrosine transport system substrate-binding protein